MFTRDDDSSHGIDSNMIEKADNHKDGQFEHTMIKMRKNDELSDIHEKDDDLDGCVDIQRKSKTLRVNIKFPVGLWQNDEAIHNFIHLKSSWRHSVETDNKLGVIVR